MTTFFATLISKSTPFPRFSIFILFFCSFVLLFFFCHFRTAHYKCKSIYELVEHMLWILFCIMLALPNSFEWYTRVSLTDLKNVLSTTLFTHALDFILYNTGTAHFIWMEHQSFTNRPKKFLSTTTYYVIWIEINSGREKTDLACHSYRLRGSFEKDMRINKLNPA